MQPDPRQPVQDGAGLRGSGRRRGRQPVTTCTTCEGRGAPDITAPVTPAGAFLDEDNSVIEISWTPPAAFIENGNGTGWRSPTRAFSPPHTSTGAGRAGTRRGQTGMATTLTTAQITGLTGDAYEIQVRAVNSEGTPDWPEEVLTVSVTRKPPDRPGRPVLAGSTATGLNVEWNKPEDNGSRITAYTVRRQKQGESAWKDRTYPGSVTSATHLRAGPRRRLPDKGDRPERRRAQPMVPGPRGKNPGPPGAGQARKARPCREHHHRTERGVERTGGQRVQDQRVHRPLPEAGRYGMDRPPSFGRRRPARTVCEPGPRNHEIRVKARNAGGDSPVVPYP